MCTCESAREGLRARSACSATGIHHLFKAAMAGTILSKVKLGEPP